MTTCSSHTPGPWQFGEARGQRPAWERIVAVEDGRTICTVMQHLPLGPPDATPASQGEAEANARLIAAAPDLLAALRPFAKLADEADTHKRDLHHLPCSMLIDDLRAARAAIAQAERKVER